MSKYVVSKANERYVLLVCIHCEAVCEVDPEVRFCPHCGWELPGWTERRVMLQQAKLDASVEQPLSFIQPECDQEFCSFC